MQNSLMEILFDMRARFFFWVFLGNILRGFFLDGQLLISQAIRNIDFDLVPF